MVNYNNGKIYKIENLGGDMCYIGSTTKDYLSKRMVEHRAMYKRFQNIEGANHISVFNIFDKYGIDNSRIVLVELCPCETKDQLLKREAYHIHEMECVHKVVPLRTDKQYYQDNKEKIKLKTLQYYKDNKEASIIKMKQYYEDNKEEIQLYKKKYYEDHKEDIRKHFALHAEARKTKITCACGSTIRKVDNKRHEDSTKHKSFVANQIINLEQTIL